MVSETYHNQPLWVVASNAGATTSEVNACIHVARASSGGPPDYHNAAFDHYLAHTPPVENRTLDRVLCLGAWRLHRDYTAAIRRIASAHA